MDISPRTTSVHNIRIHGWMAFFLGSNWAVRRTWGIVFGSNNRIRMRI